MSRYIEIVYDNSGSMKNFSTVNNKKKYEVAQILFEKEILPTIGIRGDKVVLRLLRGSCSGVSKAEELPNNKIQMLERIKKIVHDQSTPLFYTISDAIDSCKNETFYDDYLIFVLTDGDDTCNVKFNEVIDKNIVEKFIKFKNVNLLLAQLAIESDISSNNLTAFTNYLGGTTIILGIDDGISEMRSKMKNALKVSGFSKKRPLDYCYTFQSGFSYTWDQVEELGIMFYEASLLFVNELIEWEPSLDELVTPLQLEELKFLSGLMFKTDLPSEYVKAMLAELKKPYYYSHNCIYWDFSAAKWKYFKSQNQIRQVDNPTAADDDMVEDGRKSSHKNDQHFQTFIEKMVYRVELGNTLMPTFALVPLRENTDFHITLKMGDRVKFVFKD
ncbi:MAG: hypothetical protein WCG95_04190 [bacterium]